MHPSDPPRSESAADAGEDEPYAILPRPAPRWLRRLLGAYDVAELGVLAAVTLLMIVAIVVGIIDRLVGLL
jgi:hypothetical protein